MAQVENGMTESGNVSLVSRFTDGRIQEDLLHIALRHRWVILSTTILFLGAAFLYILKATPIYTSTSRLYVEQSGPKIINEYEGVMTRASNYLFTQAELMKSTPIIADVVDDAQIRQLRTFAKVDNLAAYLKKNFDLPIFTQVVETVRALGLSHKYYWELQEVHAEEKPPQFEVNQTAVRAIIEQAQTESRNLLLHEAVEVLIHYGIPVARSIQATTIEEVQDAAEKIGYPVAIKVISEDISHKSDVGGVQLNLRNAESVTAAFEDMTKRIQQAYPDVKIDGVLVQPMATGGRELILGGRQDDHFGLYGARRRVGKIGAIPGPRP